MAEVGEDFRQQLLDDGAISDSAKLIPLTGGVSSDIYKVEDGDRVFVVKRALEKLKVADDWHADLSRNEHEAAYLDVVGEILPDAVPKVLFHNSERGYFAMEFLDASFRNWKTMLLGGDLEAKPAEVSGHLLGLIHGSTWEDPDLRNRFDTTENFHDLRLDPYLLKSAERNPDLSRQLLAEAEKIRKNRRCLVHGDFSPKNLLWDRSRIVVLDCEVAWFGDPAFDVAFLLNHLMIKGMHVSPICFDMARSAWRSYANTLTNCHPEPAEGPHDSPLASDSLEANEVPEASNTSEPPDAESQPGVPRQARDDRVGEIERRLTTLLPALMLARVDGKSPVEYLNDTERVRLREFSRNSLQNPSASLKQLFARAQGTL